MARRHKRNRSKVKTATKQLANLVARPTTRPAVHLGGQRTTIDPANPEGLSRFQRELIRDATRIQHCQAQGEVMSSHMIIQTAYGWMVRACHPANDIPETIHTGRIATLDEAVTQPKHSRRIIMQRNHERDVEAENRARLKALSARRGDVYQAISEEV